MPPTTHNTSRIKIHSYTAKLCHPHRTSQATNVLNGAPNAHTPHAQVFLSTANTSAYTLQRTHSRSLTSGDQSRVVCSTGAFDIIGCGALLFESLNKPYNRVSLCIFIPGSVSPHPPQQHIHIETARYLVTVFAPVSLGSKARQTHTELSSFMT